MSFERRVHGYAVTKRQRYTVTRIPRDKGTRLHGYAVYKEMRIQRYKDIQIHGYTDIIKWCAKITVYVLLLSM